MVVCQGHSLPLYIDATGFEHEVVLCTIHTRSCTTGQGKAGKGRARQGRAGQGWAGQGTAGHCRVGLVRAGQGRAGHETAEQGREQGRVEHTSSEFVDGNGVLDVLQGQCPVAPNNPWMNEPCRRKDIKTSCRQEQARAKCLRWQI